MSEICTAIGHQLQADYLPGLASPLPSELEKLVAQLVAFEARAEKRPTTSTAISAVAAAE